MAAAVEFLAFLFLYDASIGVGAGIVKDFPAFGEAARY